MSFLHKISLLEWFLRFSQKTQKVQKIYPIGVTFRKCLGAASEKKQLALGKAKKWSKNLRSVFLLFAICLQYGGYLSGHWDFFPKSTSTFEIWFPQSLSEMTQGHFYWKRTEMVFWCQKNFWPEGYDWRRYSQEEFWIGSVEPR